MKRAAEILIFGSLAVGVHVAGFYTISAKGVQAGGSGGVETVSILRANPQIETMVAEWEKPPAPVETLDIKPITPPTLDNAPSIHIPTSQIAAVLLPSIVAPTAPSIDEPVKVETKTAKPKPKPKVVKKQLRRYLWPQKLPKRNPHQPAKRSKNPQILAAAPLQEKGKVQ